MAIKLGASPESYKEAEPVLAELHRPSRFWIAEELKKKKK